MKLENSRTIAAAPDVVWRNLVDVEVLKQCIPGCESMEETVANAYALTMKAKVGPVSATFKGQLTLEDIVEQRSYTLRFNGQGGAAGFGKGSADVRLEPHDAGTILHYSAQATVGGRIAQVGQRLVDGAAHKMAEDFFSRFEQIVAPASAAGGEAAAPAPTAGGSAARWLWVAAAVAALIVIVYLVRGG